MRNVFVWGWRFLLERHALAGSTVAAARNCARVSGGGQRRHHRVAGRLEPVPARLLIPSGHGRRSSALPRHRRLAACGRHALFPTLQTSRRPAGCQPATQQTASLRYGAAAVDLRSSGKLSHPSPYRRLTACGVAGWQPADATHCFQRSKQADALPAASRRHSRLPACGTARPGGAHASIPFTTCPCTSVRRNCRPW